MYLPISLRGLPGQNPSSCVFLVLVSVSTPHSIMHKRRKWNKVWSTWPELLTMRSFPGAAGHLVECSEYSDIQARSKCQSQCSIDLSWGHFVELSKDYFFCTQVSSIIFRCPGQILTSHICTLSLDLGDIWWSTRNIHQKENDIFHSQFIWI